jgi:hypothetical protein
MVAMLKTRFFLRSPFLFGVMVERNKGQLQSVRSKLALEAGVNLLKAIRR